jgi:L-2,4-diaminobutyric acid acetyltransferase
MLRLQFAMPTARDGAAVHELVRNAGGLDLNSSYAYLLICDRFGSTSRVARFGGALAGAVLGFRGPDRLDTLFVWQIAVRNDVRGSGLGRILLERLIESDGCRGVRFLEAHVALGNHASEALFRSFARVRRAEVRLDEDFRAEDFPDAHAPERLIRIGPFG